MTGLSLMPRVKPYRRQAFDGVRPSAGQCAPPGDASPFSRPPLSPYSSLARAISSKLAPFAKLETSHSAAPGYVAMPP